MARKEELKQRIQRAFEADARCAVMMQMLEIAGFPVDDDTVTTPARLEMHLR
jgi:hypothetical protein